jgi:hypothetical protein
VQVTSCNGEHMTYKRETLKPARRQGRLLTAASILLIAAASLCAQPARRWDFEFEKVVDSTQGFSDFQTFPAINSRGAVAFVAFRSGVGNGVFRAREGAITNIATEQDGLRFFGGAPAMNAAGVVAFTAATSTGSTAIFRGDGLSKVLIADSLLNGLSRIGLGSPAINADGLVAFSAPRSAPRSPASIFTGDGGALRTVFSTSTTGFRSFGNVAINNSGTIAFNATLVSGIQGVFTGRSSVLSVLDANTSPEFDAFGEPAINNAGTVAGFASLFSGAIQIFSGNARGVTLRNDAANPMFTACEHPSINNHGAVAFYAFPMSNPSDPTGIFLEVSGGHTLIAVIRPGDKLFGSTVTSVDMGRFALNDRMELAFQYALSDGRTGIATASFHGETERHADNQESAATTPIKLR